MQFQRQRMRCDGDNFGLSKSELYSSMSSEGIKSSFQRVNKPPALQTALAFSVLTIGHISGAYLNPTITIGTVTLLSLKSIPIGMVYILGQLIDAIVGYGILKWTTLSAEFNNGKSNSTQPLCPYTGCNINPVRSFAPAFWNGNWKDHWVSRK
ncbi:hypothetical protein ALC53_05175 [Atta colombica]|uniref:Uncharacterized protein n=1 Tax=Atta colombica TaxID=520822 RepID=A0A151I453_9HYME|nr:hypothetical protein ALC53_05175 [Atta colombica]